MRSWPLLLVAVLAILLLAVSAQAQNVSVSPASLYEGTSATFRFGIDNYGAADVVTSVVATLPGFSELNASDILGWDESVSGDSASWSNGTLETNVALAYFDLSATAPVQSGNGTTTATVSLGNTSYTLDVIVLDDPTPPALGSPSPAGGALIAANSSSLATSIIASDGESGMDAVTFSHGLCSGNASSSTALTANGSTYSAVVDFSAYTTTSAVCFTFTATNKAGDSSSYSGNLTLDGVAPTVSITAPSTNSSVGAMPTLSVLASDDLANTLLCSADAANTSTSFNASSGVPTNVTLDLSGIGDGPVNITVDCQDTVGHHRSAALALIADTTAPSITLVNPADGSQVNGDTLNYTITDANGVATVTSSHSTDISSWSEGYNTVLVSATDNAGNSESVGWTFLVDRSAPLVTLVSPVDAASTDTHLNLSFSATDDRSPTLSCMLDLTGQNTTLITNDTATLEATVALGAHNWSVSCTDIAGNTGSSSTRSFTAEDRSGPDISSSFSIAQRGFPNTIPATITDPSGVDTAWLEFETQHLPLVGDGNYTANLTIDASHALGNYTLSLHANDSNGYESSLDVPFELVRGIQLSFTSNAPVGLGDQLIFTLTVATDDGANLSDTNVTLIDSADRYQANSSLDETNTFSDQYAAPISAGTYELTAELIEDGLVYRGVHRYTVVAPPGTSNTIDPSHGSGSFTRGFGSVVTDSSGTERGSNPPTTPPSDTNAPSTTDGATIPVPEPSPAEEPRQPTGVGQASGVLNLGALKTLWWVLLALAALVLGLTLLSRYRKATESAPARSSKEGDADDIDWDGYFDRK